MRSREIRKDKLPSGPVSVKVNKMLKGKSEQSKVQSATTKEPRKHENKCRETTCQDQWAKLMNGGTQGESHTAKEKKHLDKVKRNPERQMAKLTSKRHNEI